MGKLEQDIRELILLAGKGDQAALGQLLEHHRPYLKMMTQRVIGHKLGARIDASDIVQQTCISVFGRFSEFVGDGANEFLAWLRVIHQRNVQNALRDNITAQKRSINREQRLMDGDGLGPLLQIEQSSPSQRVMNGERAVQLAKALQHLPVDQRDAIRLRFLEGWSLQEISEHKQRTKYSIAGLIKRGLQQLRKTLRDTK